MTDVHGRRRFLADGVVWTVARRTGKPARHTGLTFEHRDARRFLVFTRGVMPTDRELGSMGPEVLRVLLRRSVRDSVANP